MPRDAELLYKLRPLLKADFDSATRQRSAGASGSSVTFVPAEGGNVQGAMLFLRGTIVRTGTHGGASAAEMGEGRLQFPVRPPDPGAKRLSVSPDDVKPDEEGVPKRGISAPPLSSNLTSAVSSKKTDVGWNEDRVLYRRFGHMHIMGSGPPNECPMIIESDDSLT